MRLKGPAVVAGLLLAGCVTDDPNQGGFIGGIAGIANGTYARNVEVRQQRLSTLQEVNASLSGENARLAGDLWAGKAEQGGLIAETRTLEADIRRLKVSAERSARLVTEDRQRLATAEQERLGLAARIEELKRQIQNHTISHDEAMIRMDQLRQQQQQLEPIFDALQ